VIITKVPLIILCFIYLPLRGRCTRAGGQAGTRMAESGSTKSGNRNPRLHLDRNYLTITGIAALLLLYLTILSVQQEGRIIQNSSASNLRLGERLAIEVERQAYDVSQACLTDSELCKIALALSDNPLPDDIRSLHARLAAVRKNHPIAAHIFVMSNGAIVFPYLKDPIRPRNVSLLNGSPQYPAYESLLEKAVKLTETRRDLALPIFMKCAGLDVKDELKAMALLQAARCYANMGKPTEAVRAYDEIEIRYGDCYDNACRPYAVIAAIERDKLVKAVQPSRENLINIYRQMMRGRWQLSEPSLYSLRSSIERSLGPLVPADRENQFSEQFEIARAVQAAWLSQAPSVSQPIIFRPVSAGGAVYQTCYTSLAGDKGRQVLLGFSADSGWVSSRLLSKCGRDTGVPQEFTAATIFTNQPRDSMADDIRIPFRIVFPSAELHLPLAAAQARSAAIRRDILFGIISVMVTLGVLILIVVVFLRALKEMQVARMRSDVMSGISHGLNTPASVISLYCETLMTDEGMSEEGRRTCYATIYRESERLVHMVKNLLYFSSLAHSRDDCKLSEGDLIPLVTQTVSACAHQFQERGFTVKSEMPASLPAVRFNSEKVSQALVNLIDNARKYSGNSKTIEVRLRADRSRVILEVQDNGIGILPEDREKLFEQFYRGNNVGQQTGFGLGLFLVDRIMDAHGGTIELESTPGRGSRFRLVFPLASAAAAQSSNRAKEQPA
jgi:signal transduction histidine kinase